jgi:hypothetical protein
VKGYRRSMSMPSTRSDGRCGRWWNFPRPNFQGYPVGFGDGGHLAVGHPGRLDGRGDGAKVPVALFAE